jgi:iron complex outermembrane receptor protein
VNQPFYEGGAPGGFTFDLTGKAPEVSFIGVDPNKPSDLAFDFGSLHEITNDDKESYFFFDYERDISNGWLKSIKVGAKYSNHDRETVFNATTWGGFFLPLSTQGCGGGACTSSNFFGGNLTPSDFLSGIGAPGSLASYWQVDRKKLQDIYYSQPESVRKRVINPPENFTINEKVMGGYAMASLGGEGQPWRGNIGVRVVITDQTSTGNLLGVTGPGVVTDNPFGIYTPIRTSRSYTDWLPSANFSYDVRPDLVVRVAAGRTMARPDYTDVVPRVSLNPGTLTGNGGNPLVDPYRADGVDLSVEWYPNKDAIIAAAFYYKDIKSYLVNSTVQQTYPIQTSNPNPSRCVQIPGDNLYNCLFDVNVRSNGGGGTNKGVELQVSTPIWAGFGFTGNYTFSDAKSDDGDQIPGNSKHSLNVTGWYENGPFQGRLSYNYRSDFFINIDRASPLNQGSTDSLDASMSFDITENFSLMADAVNLTNSKITQFSGTTDRPRAIYDNGRQFSFGVRAKF